MTTLAVSRTDIPHLGFAFGLLAAACLSMQDALIKWITEDAHISQAILLRGAVGVFLATMWALKKDGLSVAALKPQKPLLVGLRAVFHAASWWCYYTALTMLPLAIYAALGFMVYIFVAALSGVFLGERTDKLGWLGIAAGLLGAIIIVSPGDAATAINYGAAALLLFGALLWAFSILLTRALGPIAGAVTIMFWTHVALTLIGVTVAFFNWRDLSPSLFSLMLLAAFIGAGGHLSAITAYRTARVEVVIPTQYTTLLWAGFLGWFLWGEAVTVQLILGATMIMLSGGATYWRRRARPRAAINRLIN